MLAGASISSVNPRRPSKPSASNRTVVRCSGGSPEAERQNRTADILRDTDPAACQETPGIDRADIWGKERGRPSLARSVRSRSQRWFPPASPRMPRCRCPDKCLHPLGRVKTHPGGVKRPEGTWRCPARKDGLPAASVRNRYQSNAAAVPETPTSRGRTDNLFQHVLQKRRFKSV